MPLTAGGTAPYAPPATVIEVLRRYRDRGLLHPVTTEVLERAGVPATLSQRTLQALKLLGLIDSEGKATPEFEAANRAPDAEYKERLGELITETYSEVIRFADPATDSYDRVRDAFRGYNPRGQQERMVPLFLGLLEYVGLDISAASASRRRGATNGSAPAPKPRPSAERGSTQRRTTQRPSAGRAPGHRGDPRDAALVAWFDTRPDPSTPWPRAARDSFMTTLRSIIDGVYSDPDEQANA